MSCISSLLFTCIPCLCDIKFINKQTNKKKTGEGSTDVMRVFSVLWLY